MTEGRTARLAILPGLLLLAGLLLRLARTH
jgi:hypothetical protein